AAAVHLDVAVVHELARREDGGCELGAIHHRIEPALQQTNEVLRRVALPARGFLVGLTELLFGDVAVVETQLLLGYQLQPEVRGLALPALAVLARAVLALVDRRLRATPKVLPEAAVGFVFGLDTLRHGRIRPFFR